MVKDNINYLYGEYVTLEPISTTRHGYELYKNLNHPQLWDYFYSRPYVSFVLFEDYVKGLEHQKLRRIQNYAVCNALSGQPLGFLGIDDRQLENDGSIEVVNVMFSPKLQKTTMATQAFFLVAKHCFERLNCDQLQWRCDLNNQNSFRAAERFGFYYDGVQPDGGHHYNFFYMIHPEWEEAIKKEYRRWLEPANFEASGKQKTKLELRKQ